MLVLSRRLGETIAIGDSIKITIIGVSSGIVRIGIDAPKSIGVHREEVYLRNQQQSGALLSVSDK